GRPHRRGPGCGSRRSPGADLLAGPDQDSLVPRKLTYPPSEPSARCLSRVLVAGPSRVGDRVWNVFHTLLRPVSPCGLARLAHPPPGRLPNPLARPARPRPNHRPLAGGQVAAGEGSPLPPPRGAGPGVHREVSRLAPRPPPRRLRVGQL